MAGVLSEDRITFRWDLQSMSGVGDVRYGTFKSDLEGAVQRVERECDEVAAMLEKLHLGGALWQTTCGTDSTGHFHVSASVGLRNAGPLADKSLRDRAVWLSETLRRRIIPA